MDISLKVTMTELDNMAFLRNRGLSNLDMTVVFSLLLQGWGMDKRSCCRCSQAPVFISNDLWVYFPVCHDKPPVDNLFKKSNSLKKFPL